MEAQLWSEALSGCWPGQPECMKAKLVRSWKTNPNPNKAFSSFNLVATFKEKGIHFQSLNGHWIWTWRPVSLSLSLGWENPNLSCLGRGSFLLNSSRNCLSNPHHSRWQIAKQSRKNGTHSPENTNLSVCSQSSEKQNHYTERAFTCKWGPGHPAWLQKS